MQNLQIFCWVKKTGGIFLTRNKHFFSVNIQVNLIFAAFTLMYARESFRIGNSTVSMEKMERESKLKGVKEKRGKLQKFMLGF